jgi:O-antigen/teichoic acid export membrane protein
MIKWDEFSSLAHNWQDLLLRKKILGKGKVLRNIAFLSGGSAFAQVLTAVNAILLARFLSPEGYGLFISAYAAAGLTSFLFNWGLDTWLLRQASISQQPRNLLGSVIAIKTGFGFVWVLGLLIILPQIRPDLFIKALLLVSALDIWCDGLFNAGTASLNAQKRVSIVSMLLLLSRGTRLLGTIILIFLGASLPVIFATGRLAGTLIALIIVIFILKPTFITGLVSDAVRIFRDSIPYGLSDLLATIYLQADVTLLAIIAGSKVAVGLYSPASSLVNALFIIPAAIYAVMIPVLTRLLESNRLDFHRHVRFMYAGFIALGLLMWLGIGFGGGFLVNLLLGPSYSTTGRLLVILSPILLLKAVSFASAAVLVAVGWQKYRLTPQAISAIANVILNLYFIPQFGVVGVASVYVVSEIVLTTGYIAQSARWFRANPIIV